VKLSFPVGPEARRLRFLFETTSGATPSSSVEEYWDGDINWVTPEDLGKLSDRYVRETRRRITEEGYKSCGVSLAPPGSLVLSKRAPIGQTAILDVPSTCNQGCLLLTKLDGASERFYYYALIHLRPALEALGRGSTFMELSADDLRSVSMPFPTKQNQGVIASYLERETARIDRLIAEKERMLALLQDKRAALISRVVSRGIDPDVGFKPSGLEWLDEIPAHWETCQLKRTWASSDYGLSESIRDEGDIAVLRMSCIVDGRVDVSKSGMIAEVDSHLLLRRNDLLFNRTNSLDQIAKVGLVDFDPIEPLTFASYLVRIRTNHRATPQYLVALLNSSLFLEFARKNAIPAIGQANLSPTRYGEIHIPLPPKSEQEQIVKFLERDAEISTPVREHIRSSISLLKERRAALISAAVTGQIPLEEMTG
jgi:type I restriction enzyme S subunit